MQAHAVADLAGNPQHRLADSGDRHRHHRQSRRLRREVRSHQSQLVMFAPVIELFTRLPAAPDRAQRPHIILEPRRRRAPRDAEAAFVVAFDLTPQPEDEPAVRIRLQIPRLAGQHRRAARKGDGDRRRQLDPLGREHSKGERREDVVSELGRHHRIEPGGFRRGRGGSRFAPAPHRQHREDAHPIHPILKRQNRDVAGTGRQCYIPLVTDTDQHGNR